MDATPLLLLLAVAIGTALCIEVSNKLDLWDEANADTHENEVEPQRQPPALTVVDVRVVVGNGSAGSASADHPRASPHYDIPVYVPVQLVTPKPSGSRPWKHHASYAPTSNVGVRDVPVFVPVANSVPSNSQKVHYEDIPVLIGSSGVKQVKTEGSEKTVPVIVPISINISTGKEDRAPATHEHVPVIIGSGSSKPLTTTSKVPPDVPVVYGLNLGPQFHRRGGGSFMRPARPLLEDRTFWWPPVVGLAPRPWLPPVHLPLHRPQPPQQTARPVTPTRTTTTTTTTASSLLIDDKLDFGDA